MSMVASKGAGLLIESLPADWREARLLGRFELPQGPTPVLCFSVHYLRPSRIVMSLGGVSPTRSAMSCGFRPRSWAHWSTPW